MEITRHIDWLSVSIPKGSTNSVPFPAFIWSKVGRGAHGYATRLQDRQHGITYETDNATLDMPDLLVFSGETLSSLRTSAGMVDAGLVEYLIRNRARCSRIDLTINIHDGKLTPRKIQQAVNSGAAKPKANVSRFIEGKSGDVAGDTFYIGSPTSDRQFRAYNKAAEMGVVDGQAWLRLELELRRLRANGAFQSVASNGVDATVSGHMADFLNWGDVEYQTALSGQSVPPVDIPRRDSNRRRWLTGQVAQALAKEMMLDDEFANVFWQHVQSEFSRLQAD